MNDSDRTALVEELAEAIEDFLPWFPHGEYSLAREDVPEVVASVMPIIERLLAAAAATTVDDDAVERAAKAMYRLWCSESRHKMSDEEIEEGWEKHRQWTYENNWEPTPKVFGMARAALAAAGITPGDAREGGEGQ